MLHGIGMEEMEDVVERKTVLLAERNVQAVVSCGSLQFKIERAAETFAKRQPPGFVDARAERGVNDELHAAALIKEAFGDDCSLRGNCAEDRAAGSDIFGGLLGAGLVDTTLRLEPAHG